MHKQYCMNLVSTYFAYKVINHFLINKKQTAVFVCTTNFTTRVQSTSEIWSLRVVLWRIKHQIFKSSNIVNLVKPKDRKAYMERYQSLKGSIQLKSEIWCKRCKISILEFSTTSKGWETLVDVKNGTKSVLKSKHSLRFQEVSIWVPPIRKAVAPAQTTAMALLRLSNGAKEFHISSTTPRVVSSSTPISRSKNSATTLNFCKYFEPTCLSCCRSGVSNSKRLAGHMRLKVKSGGPH